MPSPLAQIDLDTARSGAARSRGDWERYLDALKLRDKVSARLVDEARKVWGSLAQLMGAALPPPQAGPTAGRGLLMAWSIGRDYFEIELKEEGSHDWFYRNRVENSFRSGENVGTSNLVSQAAFYLKSMLSGEGS